MKKIDVEPTRILVVGEALMDRIVSDGSGVIKKTNDNCKPGGAPLNFALAIKQIVPDAEVDFLSAVGHDDYGCQLRRLTSSRGVNSYICSVDNPTGLVDAVCDENGIPSYTIHTEVAYDEIPLTRDVEALVTRNGVDVFYYGTLASRSATKATRATLKRLLAMLPEGVMRCFDCNLRPTFSDMDFLVWCLENATDVLKINNEELCVVADYLGYEEVCQENLCERLMQRFPKMSIVALTCGTDGSYVFTKENRSFIDTPKVKVCDTIGCGDVWAAGLVGGLVSGMSLVDSHRLAVEASAFAATQPGGQPILHDIFSIATAECGCLP